MLAISGMICESAYNNNGMMIIIMIIKRTPPSWAYQ